MESHVLEMPEDMAARVELLQLYLEIVPPPGFDSARRSVRLQHILYMVEHNPEAPPSASRAAYVYRANGPYANPADHEAVRERWLASGAGPSEKHGGNIQRGEVSEEGRPGRCRASAAPRFGCRSG